MCKGRAVTQFEDRVHKSPFFSSVILTTESLEQPGPVNPKSIKAAVSSFTPPDLCPQPKDPVTILSEPTWPGFGWETFLHISAQPPPPPFSPHTAAQLCQQSLCVKFFPSVAKKLKGMMEKRKEMVK